MFREQDGHTYSPGRDNLVAITMGCPVGVGPEIILRFLSTRSSSGQGIPIVVGDIGVLRRCAAELRLETEIRAWQPGREIEPGIICVIEPPQKEGCSLEAESLHWGEPDGTTGRAAADYIIEAVRLIKNGDLDALVTCPIAKHAMQLAGYAFPGHTEMLASLCGSRNFGMMMAGRRLKVSLVTIHKPLAEVARELNQSEIRRIIELTGETLIRDFAITRPRIAVAGFNPHGGESGLFGQEEKTVIEPAVAATLSEKWELQGPLPPDTVFKMAFDRKYDAVVAMYHDQGLIPFKMVHFEDGVNLTMGLPIIRTSVDHGTAYDIAGKGIASDSSLAAAFQLACEIIQKRKKRSCQVPDAI